MTKGLFMAFPSSTLIVPGYLLALMLAGYTDPAFVAIAFDSGGDGDRTDDGHLRHGHVGGYRHPLWRKDLRSWTVLALFPLVFLAPILSVMLLGLAYRRKEKKEG